MKRIVWEVKGGNNGHAWEYGYWGDRLFHVRCANCKRQPIELLYKGGGFQGCRGNAFLRLGPK